MENFTFAVLDQMVNDDPMKYQSIEVDLEGNIYFLSMLNKHLRKSPIERLVDRAPEEFEFIFQYSDDAELQYCVESLLSSLN